MNFRTAWRPAGMSHHNQQRGVEEGRSLLGGTHATKSVKFSVDILEGLSTGVNMGVSAPKLILQMVALVAVALVLMSYKGVVVIFVAPHAPAFRRNLLRDLKF